MSSMQATATNVVGGQEDETAAQQAQPPVPNPAQSGVPIGEQQGPQQATQGQMTSTGAPTDCTKFTPDSEKCRFIQEYLVFLLHADKCQRCENQANEMERCTLSRCKTMKKVLKHTTNCTRGKNGFVSPCSMSKSIINHWKYCNRSDCPICMPIKNRQRIGKDNFMDSMFNIKHQDSCLAKALVECQLPAYRILQGH